MHAKRVFVLSGVAAMTILGASKLAVGSSPAQPGPLPLSSSSYVLGDALGAYEAFMMSGGPPPDGIPSIDAPQFVSASAARLQPGDMVIGFQHRGEARAYPQRLLVHHEIVNDRVGGLNIAVTYCPLTATAQGFERGTSTLGVSGRLLNSNLVMYDRESGTLFSQINATGLRGKHRGRTLAEVELVWTTWEKWRAAHPETRVLSDRTGHLRNYARDPYGSYNPRQGYYQRAATIFPVMHESKRQHAKEMVVGARTSERSAYFVMAALSRNRLQATENFVAVHDRELDAGYVYLRDPKGPRVTPRTDGRFEVGGSAFRADALPLKRLVAVEAFHFAWHAFYPNSEKVR